MIWRLLVIITAIFLWFFHSWYTYRLFENARFFSHLSDFEREMTYRTEMGLYFSFYKTMVSAPTFWEGLRQLMADNVTEYGHTINALQRFNLYPELILSASFRSFKQISKHLNWIDQVCWRVNRGGGMGPVESCEGLGNLHYFYIYGVFFCAGLVLCAIFIGGVLLGESYFGGLLAASAFMFNHVGVLPLFIFSIFFMDSDPLGEATRVQWTPPLRESFAYPIFLAQMILLGHILCNGKIGILNSCFLIFTTTLFCAFWQLSQFIIGTQLGSIVLLFSLEMISSSLMASIFALFSISFCFSFLLLFGTSIFLNSLFLTSLLSIFCILLLRFFFFNRIRFRSLFIFFHLATHFIITFGTKFFFQRIFGLNDDSNVIDLLKAKLLPGSNFATFHTRLYTCAPEFDFLQFEPILKLTQTWVLPISAAAFCLWLLSIWRFIDSRSNLFWRQPKINQKEEIIRQYSQFAYHFAQLFCFLLMALLIMRLKLFATPQLCLISSICLNPRILASTIGRPFGGQIFRFILVGILLAGMAQKGLENVKEQLEMQSEFNNPEQENLFKWIQQNTKSDAVFAGTMALMANLKLSTLHPIVNHPHYESQEMRNRTLQVYGMYSRKDVGEVYSTLREMGVHFFVFQPQQCLEKHPKVECSYLAMWDLEDPPNRNRPSLCHCIWEGAIQGQQQSLLGQFRPVYSSPSYIVLALLNE